MGWLEKNVIRSCDAYMWRGVLKQPETRLQFMPEFTAYLTTLCRKGSIMDNTHKRLISLSQYMAVKEVTDILQSTSLEPFIELLEFCL